MANKLFEEEKYVEATPLYSQLLSNNAASPEYNYRYGTCLLFSDGEKATGLKHLVFAAQSPNAPKECFYFLGRGYHLNYQFALAISAYQKYASMATPKEMEKYQVQRQIEMCNNGRKLLRNITDLVVIDKRDIDEERFFRLYSMKDIGGQLIVVEALQSSLDKKKNHRVVIHNPKNSDVVFYSSYGSDGKNGLDIYKVKRLPNGEWAQPQIVKGFVNTQYDEDFPYMHPDGRTLYFCSKGHNSMGGYDIFRSVYDPESDQFSSPENVDFAISSPDDDMFYVVDSLDRMAWFASKRESENGKIHVYNVRVERIPILLAIIKGKFTTEISPSNLGASIRVEDMSTNEVVGIYNTKATDGNYLITLPKSGKYKFTVVSDNSKIAHVGIVDVPYQKELRPLKQELQLVNNSGTEQLRIKNMFDQEVDDADAIVAQILKEKGLLNPNAADWNLDSLDKVKETKTEVKTNDKVGNYSDQDLVDMVKKDADDIANEVKELKETVEAAYVVADKKNDLAREKSKEAEILISKLNTTTDEQEKKQIIEEANNLNNDSRRLITESAAAYEVAKGLEEQVKKKEQEAVVAKEFANGIEQAINTKNRTEAEKKLREQQAYIRKVMETEPNRKDELDDLRAKAATKKQESDKALQNAQTLRQDEADLTVELNSLKRQQEAAKNDKKKQEIQAEIDRKTEDLNQVKVDLKTAFNKFEMLEQEVEILNSQISVLEEIQSGTVSGTLTEAEKNALEKDLNSGTTSRIFEENDKKLRENVNEERSEQERLNKYLYGNPLYEGLLLKDQNVAGIGDKKKRMQEENKVNKEWLKTIDQDLADLKSKLKNENDPAKQKELKNQISDLTNYRKVKEEKIAANEKELGNSTGDVIANNTTNDKETKVDPQYNDKVKEIKSDPGLTKEQKLEKENQLNRELVMSIDEKIEANNKKMIEADPQDRDKLEAENKELYRLKEQKNEDIRNNERKISTGQVEENNTAIVADVNTVDPKFTASKDKINSSNKSPEEKLKEENKLNQNLIAKIDKEIVATDKKLSTAKEEDKLKLQEKKEGLENLKKQTQEEIASNEKEIAQLKNQQNTTNVARVDVNTVDPNYENKRKEIQSSNSSAKEKLQQENELDKNLLIAVEERIQEVDRKLESGTPEEKIAAQQEKNQLQNLKNEKEQHIASNEKKITAIESGNNVTDPSQITSSAIRTNPNLQSVDPSYNAQLNAIENSNLSPQEKALERKKLNETTITRVDAAINKENAAGNTRKVEELNTLKEQLTAMVTKDEAVIAGNNISSNVAKENAENTAKNVDPSYESNVDAIENSNKSDIRKTSEIRKLNEEMVRKTDDRIAQLENELSTGTAKNPEANRKEIEALKELKSEKENEIAAADKKLIDAGVERTDENGRAVSGYAFMPEYGSSEAQSIIASIQPLIEKVRVLEEELTELKLRRAEATSESEKQKITDQILAKEQELTRTELEIAAKVEQANKAEKNRLDTQLSAVKADVKNVKVPADNADLLAAQTTEEKAKTKFEDAKKFRAEAAKEKDEKKKNLLLMKANVAEQLGNKYLENAANSYRKAIRSTTGVNAEEPIVNVAAIYPEYTSSIDNANSATTTEQKLEQRIQANQELVKRLEAELAALKDKKDPASNEKRTAIEQLLNQKKNEITSDQNQLQSLRMSPQLSSNQQNVLSSVDPSYSSELDRINASVSPEVVKAKERTALNEQLIEKINKEIADLNAVVLTTTNEEEKRNAENRIEQLQELKRAKLLEIGANRELMAKSGFSFPNPELNYENTFDYSSEKGKTEIASINTQLEEIRKEREKLENLQAQRAVSTDKNEQKKLDKEIATLQNDLITRETNVSASFAMANAAERENLEKKIEEKKKEAGYKDIPAGHPALKKVEELRNEANKEFELAADLRAKAAIEKDKKKKNELLKEANSHEVKGNELLAQADRLMDVLLGDVSIAQNNSNGNNGQNNTTENNGQNNNGQNNTTDNNGQNNNGQNNTTDNNGQNNTTSNNGNGNLTDNNGNQNIAQNKNKEGFPLNENGLTSEQMADPSNRKSSTLFKEADDLKEQAENLRTRATELEDSSKTVKKKYRQAILDDAAQKRKEADALDQRSNEVLASANTQKQTEDRKIEEQRQRENDFAAFKEREKDLVKSPEYARYYQLKREADAKNQTAKRAEENLNRQNDIATKMRDEVKSIRTASANETDNIRKNQMLTQASDLERQAIREERKRDSLRLIAEQRKAEAVRAENEANNYLASIDPRRAEDIRTLASNSSMPNPEGNSTVPSVINTLSAEEIARKYTVPDRVETEIFAKSDKAVYNAANPIPVDPVMPKGVYFKVQVGAFRNPIPNETFKEFAPITGERTPAGLTRYTVGYFTNFNSANDAKNEIRGMGYSDAFVVGFKDGKRIPLNEALAEIGQGNLAQNNTGQNNNGQNNNGQNNNGQNNNGQNNNGQNNNGQNNNGQNGNTQEYVNTFVPDRNATNYYNETPGAAKANQVEVIAGLFFTVQVGVYSKPVSPDKIFNLNPLNSEKLNNGTIRYTTGVFTNFDVATSRRDQIRQIGVTDAFVRAYMNGKPITIQQARDSIAKYGASVYVKDASLISNQGEPTVINNNQQNNNQQNNNQQNNNQQNNNQQNNNQQNVPQSSSYKVILGQYDKEVPTKDAEIYLTNMTYGIRKATTADGKTIYFIDNITSRTEAFNIADAFIQKGIAGAYVSDKLPASSTQTTIVEAKPAQGVKFQVYIGEFIGEVPPEATEVYLNNYDKGVKRKKLQDGTIIYYVLDGDSYDEALKMKAHFISEGLSSVRIVAFSDNKEISLSKAYTAGLRFNVIVAEYQGELPAEVSEAVENIPEITLKTENLANGFTMAYAENVADLDAALKLKAKLISEGLSSVRIVAIKDGKQISLSDAIQQVYE
ncbi:MAG: hypothetical protein K1X56_07080 [Flavobacteriales bacterium]|nr:hypothetical protein [Flavobacteriales bacterium]